MHHMVECWNYKHWLHRGILGNAMIVWGYIKLPISKECMAFLIIPVSDRSDTIPFLVLELIRWLNFVREVDPVVDSFVKTLTGFKFIAPFSILYKST